MNFHYYLYVTNKGIMRLEANFQENMTKENEASMVSGTVLDFAINLLFSSIRGLQEIKQ